MQIYNMFFAIAAKNQKSRSVFENLKSTRYFAKAFKTRPSVKADRTQTGNAFFRSICSFSYDFQHKDHFKVLRKNICPVLLIAIGMTGQMRTKT